MNWFDTSGLTSLAKSALKEAQKTIDKALDIQDDSGEEQEPTTEPSTSQPTEPAKEQPDFFSSWGLTVSGESDREIAAPSAVVTESPSKTTTTQSLWGSFAGSFFEPQKPNDQDDAIVRPPKAKSMNLISDSKYDSQDDLFSKSQLVMSDGGEVCDSNKKEAIKVEDRRYSNRSNRLSLVSSHNSSESVEVLSHSVKSTPDSEGPSVRTISQSSSTGPKVNSESVEILPDSLISPSSIECLGFDSYISDKNSDTSTSPGDFSDKKLTPLGEHTEKAATADSISLVADDDEDTMSYNSISECTAPTILGAEEKTNEFVKVVRTEPKKTFEKEFIHLEQPLAQKMQISENSSNDGSWSDRTLHADGDSLILESNVGESKKDDQDDIYMEKLSDSSSFYNVNMSPNTQADCSFMDIEKQQCAEENRDCVKECSRRTSPISSDSKSDLVKIGSDRTSGHTSGDEVETATSSDIEIIPSPNGDNGNGYYRHSPAKNACKQSKFDGATSPNLVDLVLGKSLATKIRGHNRELSEASVQSNTSDESQGSENDRLMRRLCEMAEILEARENRLMEVSRSNAELAETNADLKTQVESLMTKHEVGDVNMITEDYTQRLSALEKKFQQAIREKDHLRKQLDNLKSETATKSLSETESQLKDRDEMIAQLQDEGEKLARQQLQQSNIIKKLRTKEKDNEQVIKSLRDKISEQSSELDRMKRSVAAKEELEVSQIEAVYRLTTANKKLETELMDTKSSLEDATQRLESQRASLEAAGRELAELQRANAALAARRDDAAALRERCDELDAENDRLRTTVDNLRANFLEASRAAAEREAALRAELREALAARAGGGEDAALLAAQLGAAHAAAARAAAAAAADLAAARAAAKADRDAARAHTARVESQLAKCSERERLLREEVQELKHAQAQTAQLAATRDCPRCAQLQDELRALTESGSQLEAMNAGLERQVSELDEQLQRVRRALHAETAALDAEKKRNALLQQRASPAEAGEGSLSSGAASPPRSSPAAPAAAPAPLAPLAPLAALHDYSGHSLYLPEEVSGVGGAGGVGSSAACVEAALALLSRREGELRAARAAAADLRAQRDRAAAELAATTHRLHHHQNLQEQYDALLQMYGEKEEQLQELTLDLRDLTQLYKVQLQELLALRGH